MPFSYSKVLVLGATGGIGRALAEAILQNSAAKVVVTGRSVDKLDAFVAEHGKERAASAAVDLLKLDTLEGWFKGVFAEHPDIDFVLHNAGVQVPVNFHDPPSVDLPTLVDELTLNYTSVLYTLKYAAPHLLSLEKPAAFGLVTSGLAITPFTFAGNYSATKAAVHHLVYTLRAQFKATNVKVVEILPPATESNLHHPSVDAASLRPLPIADFTAEAWAGLEAGLDTIPVGSAKQRVEAVEGVRGPMFAKMDEMIAKNPGLPPHRA
ncbi:hypothetical protein Q5752_006338 [Cryptotrichosporon argae]